MHDSICQLPTVPFVWEETCSSTLVAKGMICLKDARVTTGIVDFLMSESILLSFQTRCHTAQRCVSFICLPLIKLATSLCNFYWTVDSSLFKSRTASSGLNLYRNFIPRLKQPESEAEVNNTLMMNYISTPLYSVMARCLVKHGGNFAYLSWLNVAFFAYYLDTLRLQKCIIEYWLA